MNTMLLNHMVDVSTIPKLSEDGPRGPKYWFLILLGIILTSLVCLDSYGASRLPGVDAANKLEAAGTLLKLVDTALFIWGARIFAGIAILSAGWNLKEQRFGVAVICVVSALIFGTAPIWVKNIFDIGGGNGIFS
ncbi:MAG: hypothetical protein HOO06_05130 [Bdellovibrionaceae bacterium]|jgi:hypothetical protein|nr:hypothetical protein [Pseudobdellovibrionaceae bacterium]